MAINELDKLKGVIDGQTKEQVKEQPKEKITSPPKVQSKNQPGDKFIKDKITKERAKFTVSGKGQVKVESFDIINSKSAQKILKDGT